MDGQPFVLQRNGSFILVLRDRAIEANDANAVRSLTESLSADLRREMHLGE